jgi:hypothetical protein
MKNRFHFLSSILIVLVFLIISSCTDREEPNVSPIVGTWNYSAFDFEMFVNGQPLQQFLQALGASSQEAQETADNIKNGLFSEADFRGTVLEFRADGTYEITVDGRVEESGSYELINGNTVLRTTSDNEVIDFKVMQLTNNRLTLLLEEEESQDFFEIGLPVLLKLELELSFVK